MDNPSLIHVSDSWQSLFFKVFQHSFLEKNLYCQLNALFNLRYEEMKAW